MDDRTVAVVIVAAGRGERAGQAADGPKQYRLIGGEPVLVHTVRALEAFAAACEIVVVIHEEDQDRYARAADLLDRKPRVAIGGATRQRSVHLGLLALASAKPDVVLVHDGARPFVDVGTLQRVVDAISEDGGALPAIPVGDTLKRALPDGRIVATVDRSGIFGAQTPQGFPFGKILEAHDAAFAAGLGAFTDDAALAEWAGLGMVLVPGSSENVKLTFADDLARADAKLRTARPPLIDVRTGNGYDVHQLVPGDRITLCGVAIDHDRTLLGHSDADVGLHALTDALLATCGAGDIGAHFPPSDAQWRGASSDIFVRKAIEIVRAQGGRVANVDVTLVAEAPKIAPHREAMRQAIADMTGLQLFRVSVKATTNETIGFIGRGEGIAAIATASVVYGP